MGIASSHILDAARKSVFMTILEVDDNVSVLRLLIIHEDCNFCCSLSTIAAQMFTLGAAVLLDNNLTFLNVVFLDDSLGRLELANVMIVLVEPLSNVSDNLLV